MVADCEIVIDRLRNSAHPRFAHVIYPLDYGYLDGTTAIDGGGIDLFRGTDTGAGVIGILCTVDMMKRDAELKLLIDCTHDEANLALRFLNSSEMMAAALVLRPADQAE